MRYTTTAILPHDWHAATSTKLSVRQRGASTPDLRAAWGRTLLYLHIRVRPAHSFADDNLPTLPCSRPLPVLGSPFTYPRAGTGRRWTTRNSASSCAADECPDRAAGRARRQWMLSATSPSPSARRQSRLSGEPPPQSPSARHILDSHLLQSTAAFFHLLTRIRRQVLALLMPQSSS